MGFFKKLLGRESDSSSKQPPVPPRGGGGSSGPPAGGGGGAGGSGGGGGVSIRLDLPHEPKPENLPLLAELVVKNMREQDGVMLDYSQESLKEIDKALVSMHAEGVPPQAVADMVFCFGCYVGEVMRRKYGGEWVEPPKDIPLGPFPVLQFGNGGQCGPIRKAFKCLQNGAGDSVHYFSGAMHPDAKKQG